MADTKKMGYDPSRDEEYQKALQALGQARENKPVYANTYGAQANALLSRLIADGVTVITFNLREPTLHELFVEKVGEDHVEA